MESFQRKVVAAPLGLTANGKHPFFLFPCSMLSAIQKSKYSRYRERHLYKCRGKFAQLVCPCPRITTNISNNIQFWNFSIDISYLSTLQFAFVKMSATISVLNQPSLSEYTGIYQSPDMRHQIVIKEYPISPKSVLIMGHTTFDDTGNSGPTVYCHLVHNFWSWCWRSDYISNSHIIETELQQIQKGLFYSVEFWAVLNGDRAVSKSSSDTNPRWAQW